MTKHVTVRRATMIAALTAAWCGLWQSVSAANVIAGLAVAAVVTLSGIGTSGEGGVRLWPLAKLSWLVLKDLVFSTINVAYEILTPTDRTEEGIVKVTLPTASRDHLLLLAAAITLTPGTAVVDADPETGSLYLHVLHIDRRDAVESHVRELAGLACEALPVRTPTLGGVS